MSVIATPVAPDRFARVRFAPERFALYRLAPCRSVKVRRAADRSAPDRFALSSCAWSGSAPIVNEMRSATSEDEPISPAVADAAVNIVIHGGERGTVVVPAPAQGASAVNSSAGDGRNSIVSSVAACSISSVSPAAPVPVPEKESGWTKVQTIWTVVGVVALAVIGFVMWLAS